MKEKGKKNRKGGNVAEVPVTVSGHSPALEPLSPRTPFTDAILPSHACKEFEMTPSKDALLWKESNPPPENGSLEDEIAWIAKGHHDGIPMEELMKFVFRNTICTASSPSSPTTIATIASEPAQSSNRTCAGLRKAKGKGKA